MMKLFLSKIAVFSLLGCASVSAAFADTIIANPPEQIDCSVQSGTCVWNSSNIWKKATWGNGGIQFKTSTYYFVGAEYLIDSSGNPIAASAVYRSKDPNDKAVVGLGLISDGSITPGLTLAGSLWAKSKTDRLGDNCGWSQYAQGQPASVNQCQWTLNSK